VTDVPVRVAYDVTPVISGRTGIARYVTQLGVALEREGVKLRRFAIGRRSFALPPETRHVRVPARVVYAWWRVLPWPRIEQLAGDADVLHATGLLVPPTRRPVVVTVHDIAAVRHPELHPARHVAQQRSQLDGLDRASAIVTVSRATADDLVHLGIAPERVVVAPLGLTPLPKPAAVSGQERPAGRFLLAVGETSARKDYGVILRALPALDRDVGMVLAGPPAGDESRLRSLIAELGLSSRVKRLGAVSDALLAGLYRDAAALCFPSVAEGFGLPVLEAMAAGLPVISRDIPVIRELAGDAAVYVAGADVGAWQDAVDRVLSDSEMRARLVAAGRLRAAEFTWARTATATLAAYRLALGAARSSPDA
jgi:glycosyltransferase involved in cell wall biosynthesis